MKIGVDNVAVPFGTLTPIRSLLYAVPIFLNLSLLGCNSAPNKTPQKSSPAAVAVTPELETPQPPRFMPAGTNPEVALDTKQGTLCRTIPAAPGASDKYATLPLCAGGVSKANPVAFEWDNSLQKAPLEASCYVTKNLLPFYSISSPSTMRVTSSCIIQNRTDTVQPLIGSTDYDAMLLEPDRKTFLRNHVSLASSDSAIQPKGHVEGGLYTNADCASHQQAVECFKGWLENAKEIMLVTKGGEIKAHITMDRDSDPLGLRK